VNVRAGYSKRKRDDRQPLSGGLAALLKDWLKGRLKGIRVFAMPHDYETAEMFRPDVAARAARLAQASGPELEKRTKGDFLLTPRC